MPETIESMPAVSAEPPSPEEEDLELDEEREKKLMREHLERLASDPEYFQEKIEASIEEADSEMQFSESAFDTRAEIGLITGKLGETEVTQKTVDEARLIKETSRNALERLKELDWRQLAKAGSEGIKKFLRENWVSLTPLALIPAAMITGGSAWLATRASVELTASMFALDKVLDQMTEDAKEILPPQFLVPFLAATTNLAEAGASQASAFAGDPLSEVSATPLGSNPMNVLLTGLALSTAVKHRGEQIKKEEGIEKISTIEVLKRVEWKKVIKQLGFSGALAVDALIFQYYVRPEMKKGNMLPMGVWVGANIPMLFEYFRRTTFSKSAQLKKSFESIGTEHVERMREELLNIDEVYEQGTTPMLELLSMIELYKDTEDKKHKKVLLKELKAYIKKMKDEIQENEQFKAQLDEVLSRTEMKDIRNLFDIAKIKTGEKKKINKKKMMRMMAGIGAVAGISSVMDGAISKIPKAIPGMSKGAAGFFIMSFFSSAGEFLVSKKAFEQGNDEDAAKNISDSNAINVGLAQAAMATSATRSFMI